MMGFNVTFEGRGDGEWLFTKVALIWHFSSMNPIVLCDVTFTRKGFCTFNACKGFLSSMHSCMLLHFRFPLEQLFAIVASYTFFFCVWYDVTFKCVISFECFSTLLAGEGSYWKVNGFVIIEMASLPERFITVTTAEGFLAIMNSLVSSELMWAFEWILALATVKWSFFIVNFFMASEFT